MTYEPGDDQEQQDRREAEAFLTVLAGSRTVPVTFQTFDDDKSRKLPELASIRHGTLQDLWPWLRQMNQRGAGVFVMVNEGDGHGRRGSNVQALRALFVDDDSGSLTPQALEFTPSMIVQSLHGLHAYWLLQPGQDLTLFEKVQAGLAEHYGTDPSVKDLPRVMRVAGFLNQKEPTNPYLVRIVQKNEARFSIAEVLDGCGIPEMPAATAPTAARESAAASAFERARRWMARRDPAIEGEEGDKWTFATAAALVIDFNLEDGEALVLLREWNKTCVPPWPDDDLVQKVERARKYGKHAPGAKFEDPHRGAGSASDASNRRSPGAAAREETTSLDARCADRLCSDIGNGQRLVLRHGDDLRYCHPWKKWLVYDGSRWRLDEMGTAAARAKRTALSIYSEVAACSEAIQMGLLQKHAPKSCSVRAVTGMLSMAASEPSVAIVPEMLNRDQWLLNVRNGTIDLRTGELRPHSRADLITNLAPVDFDPKAECPTWLAFLDRIMAHDGTLISFLQRAVGYTLTGDVGADAFFFAFGGGANGKGVFLNTLTAMLGDYAAVLPAEVLLESRGERHSTDKTMLHGVRMAVCQEVKEGRRFDVGTLKALTGRDPITARRMREDNWTFLPTHKLWLAANTQPRVSENDEGTWRRILLVPFSVTIPEAERDPALSAKCAREAPGILAWAVRGLAQWRAAGEGKKGLEAPDAVSNATAAYREQEDVIGAFLRDRCVLVSSASTPKAELYAEFQSWCEAARETLMPKRAFLIRIDRLDGVSDAKVRGNRGWRGIGIQGAPIQEPMYEGPRA